MTQPLAGIRVADFSHVMAGPFASHLLRLMGADVIKIESRKGDQFRNYGSNRAFDGMSPAFIAANVGKKSIALDLKDPSARPAFTTEEWEAIRNMCPPPPPPPVPDIVTPAETAP